MLKLSPMTHIDFEEYVARLIPNFAKELEKTGEFTKSGSLQKAEQTVKEMLPDGLETKNHFLFNIWSDQDQAIGILYVALTEGVDGKHLFIYDIEIKEEFRGKGYGSLTMHAAEKFARDHGAAEIWLHVFAANVVANNLYEKMHFETRKEFFDSNGKLTSRRMAKKI